MGLQRDDAYYAGFFDGEGCIGYYQMHGSSRMGITLQTVNSNREVLDALHQRFGGSVHARKAKPGHTPTWCHRISGLAAYEMLVALRPFLLVKANRADEILALDPPAPPFQDRTHCPKGHVYDDANTGIRARGGRFCRTCERERKRTERAAA